MKSHYFLALLLATAGISNACAEPAYLTQGANLRAGPGTQYPIVGYLSGGNEVDLQGCLGNWDWCEVQAGPYNGWVYGPYLYAQYDNRRVAIVQAAPVIGVPVISFHFDEFWDTHYRDKPFYHERDRWRHLPPGQAKKLVVHTYPKQKNDHKDHSDRDDKHDRHDRGNDDHNDHKDHGRGHDDHGDHH